MTGPLVVDVYAGDLNGKPDVDSLVAAGPPWHGMIIKCSEGLYYNGGSWFQNYFPKIKTAAKDRYGKDWFRGCYHYIRIDQDAKKQAQFYQSIVDKAGGWDVGDFWPMVDVENANNPPNATAKQVIDVVSSYTAELTRLCGRAPILYGGNYLAERKITDKMGCKYLWVADYEAVLPPYVYNRLGWSWSADPTTEPPTLLAWQYCGDGAGKLKDYPMTAPVGGSGKVDISSILVANGGEAALDWIRRHLYAENPKQ